MVAASQPATVIVGRLLTQLRQAYWELEEDSNKQAWSNRYERVGHEQSAWRRIPLLLDGMTYLGASEAEVWPSEGRTASWTGEGSEP